MLVLKASLAAALAVGCGIAGAAVGARVDDSARFPLAAALVGAGLVVLTLVVAPKRRFGPDPRSTGR